MLTYYALSGLINALTSSALGLFVYVRNRRDIRNKTFGLFCLSLSVWSYFYFLWRVTSDEQGALFYARGLMAGAIFIPVFCLHHILALLNRIEEKKKILLAGYIASSIFFVSNFTPLFVKDVAPSRFIFKNWPNPGPLFHPYLVMFFAIVFYFLFLLFHAYRASTGIKRNQLWYLLIAHVIGFGGGSTNFPLWYDIPIYPVGNIFASIFIAIEVYAIVRHRLMDISVVMEKGLTYTLLMFLIGMPMYLILLSAQRFYFGSVNYGFSALLLALMVTAAFGLYVAKGKTENAVGRTFFRDRYDRYKTLSEFSRGLVTILDLKHLNEQIVGTLSRVVGVESVSLFLLDQDRGEYILEAAQGIDSSEIDGFQLSEEDPLPAFLQKGGEAVIREELQQGPERLPKEIVDPLVKIRAEAILPLIHQGRLIGFCSLGRKKGDAMYTQEELDLLMALARNAAIALENARLHQRQIKMEKELQRLHRLRAIEILAEGYAHEIRNPLVSIQTFFQLLPDHQGDSEFMTAFARQASLDARRIEKLCQEINDFVRPGPLSLMREDLNGLIRRTVLFFGVRPIPKGITIELSLSRDLPTVLLDSQRMKLALLNLLRNAVEAIAGEGAVRVATRSVKRGKRPNSVQVEINDTGVGISPEDLEHVFNPFFTTKHESDEREATGLGLTIVRQIVDQHKGVINLKSEVGVGTTVTIDLPIHSGDVVVKRESA
jgi:signal transduction histidine kinase